MENINLLQLSQSPDMVLSPAQAAVLPPHPPSQSGASPAQAAGLMTRAAQIGKLSPAWEELRVIGDRKDTACPGRTHPWRSQPTSPPSCAMASSQQVPLLSPQVQTGLAHRQVCSCPGRSGCCQLSRALLLEEMLQAGTAAPASADGEGAQDAAALKKGEEQRKEENAKLAQWVDLLLKCS